jgi:hypothetical protein
MGLPSSASVRVQDMIQTILFGTLARDEPELGRPIIPSNELRRAGLPPNQLSCFGKRIKARFLELFPNETINTHTVHTNGHDVETNCYFEKHRPAIDAALADIKQKFDDKPTTSSTGSSASTDPPPPGLMRFLAPRSG